MDSNKLVVDGFLFRSKSEYEKAKKEYETIKEIKRKLDLNNQDSVIDIYNKLVSKKYFQTAVGLSFLHDLRGYLKDDDDNVSMPYIPVIISSNATNKQLQSRKYRELKDDYNRQLIIRNRLILAVVSMIIVIVGMLFIVASNENLGYFNAEEKVINKYSAWEERLTSWEEELIKREDELKELEKKYNE